MPKPQTVLCYICGREFGSYSINVHERQCAKRWESQRNKDKKNEKDKKTRTASQASHDPWVKRYEPTRPSRLRAGAGTSKSMIDIRTTENVSREFDIYDDTNMSTRPGDSALTKKNSETSSDDDALITNPIFSKENSTTNDDDSINVTILSKENSAAKFDNENTTKTKSGAPAPGNNHSKANGDNDSKIPRPGTAVLSKKLSGTSDSSDEDTKIPRPATAAFTRKYSSPLLPSKMNANSIITGKNGENSKNHDDHHLGAYVSLRKYSAPETSTCSSPDSTSSQVSSDSVGAQEAIAPPRFRSTKNPNLLVCYICGNEFGSKSLKIHEPQCLKKWKLANPRYYSRKGNHGGMFKSDSINSLQKVGGFKSKQDTDTKKITKVRSASCENLLDSGTSGNLQSNNSLQALKELSKSHGRLYQSTKPKMEPCYICGKEVIKHSLAVHEKQCKKKWDAIKTKTEKEEKERKRSRPPTPSKRHSAHLPITIKVDKIDDNHNNTCNNVDEGQKENQALQENRAKSQPSSHSASKERKPSMVTCYLCGRAYGSASISIHEKQCQKKWEAQTAKEKEQERSVKKTRTRPRSFVL